MTKEDVKKLKNKEVNVLGIIWIGAGSSWYQGTDQVECAFQCAKICKQDWGHLFKFKRRQDFPVNLYDISQSTGGWHAGGDGVVRGNKNNEALPKIKTLYVAV